MVTVTDADSSSEEPGSTSSETTDTTLHSPVTHGNGNPGERNCVTGQADITLSKKDRNVDKDEEDGIQNKEETPIASQPRDVPERHKEKFSDSSGS